MVLPATILCADPREAERAAVARLLRGAGFTVWEATSGAEALRMAGARPDLVLLHTDLPGASGLEVCQRLKADPTLATVPVLLLSAALADTSTRLEALAAGADDYLIEPAKPQDLIAHVKALLYLTRTTAHAPRSGKPHGGASQGRKRRTTKDDARAEPKS